MIRPLFAVLVMLGLAASASFAAPAASPMPSSAAVTKNCYAAVGPALRKSGGVLTMDVRETYLAWAEKTVVQELQAGHQPVSAKCLAEVRQHDGVRTAMYGAVFPPDPSVLQNYAHLREHLPAGIMSKYRSLAIALSVSRRIRGVETPAESKSIGRDYQAGFWVDETLRLPGSEPEKVYIRDLADFMMETHTTAAEVYQDASLQEKLRAYLGKRGVYIDAINEVQKSVVLGERLKNAMILLGQRPAARDPKPSAIDWIRHLTTINASTPSSTPDQGGKPMPWPLFPIDSAPWPLLMPLAHPVPISEADYIWEAFQGAHGPDRYHTYGPYRNDDELMPDSLLPSKWFWDAWPDRIIHGGECIPLSKGTVDFYSALGKPAMWAGQPGHANLISFQYVDGAWTSEIEQAFAGGPDVTCAQWYFDEDPGTQIRFRPDYNWATAEYHLGLSLAMNVGLKSYMDTRMASNIFRTMPLPVQQTLGVKLLRSTLEVNPFNPAIWYRLSEQTTDGGQAATLAEAALKGEPGLLSGHLSDEFQEKGGAGGANAQYWRTLGQFVTSYAVLAHAPAHREKDLSRAYRFLKTAPGVTVADLLGYAAKFSAVGFGGSSAEDLAYDRKLADQGDAFGLLRMGQRYRDGEGVPQDDEKAQACVASAAGQGDVAAEMLLGDLNPSVPVNQITVTASSVYASEQHLINGVGMQGAAHDNNGGAETMWHTQRVSSAQPPANGLAPAMAWVKFDFATPEPVSSVLIWNHNQEKLTDRGFRKTRIYGSSDGVTWNSLTSSEVIELPRANGSPYETPVIIPCEASHPLKSVIIAAEAVDGNYGGDCYGLSAVYFGLPRLPHVVPAKVIAVTASSVYSPLQAAVHLVDGAGMMGALHDNEQSAGTMWQTSGGGAPKSPQPGLAPSPAWAKFDFTRPQQVSSFLIWNHNQGTLTNRGFRKTRIYGSPDGVKWIPLTASSIIELPRASGAPMEEPSVIPNALSDKPLKSVIIAAETADGNYGGDCYGLSAVRFVTK
jgi:hypothetical protein